MTVASSATRNTRATRRGGAYRPGVDRPGRPTAADVDRVTFVQGGQRLGVPRTDGSLSTGPLTAADYTAMVSPR
ncbi:hypothetical protein [Micromonospora inyonensis]|uniref:hypothetical protein n=1 Tax=Micromonospora inyonensis TaxID=47866 RepID=UPI000B822D30|nr:hypothetical protein [Micromonospora inyonensis]